MSANQPSQFELVAGAVMQLAHCSLAWSWHTNSYSNKEAFRNFYHTVIPLLDRMITVHQAATGNRISLLNSSMSVKKFSEDFYRSSAATLENVLDNADIPEFERKTLIEIIEQCLIADQAVRLRK